MSTRQIRLSSVVGVPLEPPHGRLKTSLSLRGSLERDVTLRTVLVLSLALVMRVGKVHISLTYCDKRGGFHTCSHL